MSSKKLVTAFSVVLVGAVGALIFWTANRSPSRIETTRESMLVAEEITTTQESSPTTSATHRAPAGLAKIELSTATREKLRVLDEILRSKNDNDPRLDTQFKNLTADAKTALRARYGELKLEDRNGRGTIVFLLGREMTDPADVTFMTEVLREKPCLSLSDCGSDTRSSSEPHADATVEVTLAYPQYVALRSIDQLLRSFPERANNPAYAEEVRRAIQEGRASPIPAIVAKADDLARRIKF